MGEDFKSLAENYKIILQYKDYILTTDRKVLKKNDDEKYVEADENDPIVVEMLNMLQENDDYANYYEGPDDGERE